MGKSKGPKYGVGPVAIHETGEQARQREVDRAAGSLAVEVRKSQNPNQRDQSEQEAAVQVRPQQEDQGKDPQPARQGQRERQNHDKTQEGIELRADVEERRSHCDAGQHCQVGASRAAADLPQQTKEQAEGGDQHAPLPPDQASQAEELGPGVKDDVRQPFGMEPGMAVAGEGKGLGEVESVGLRDPVAAG